MIARKDRSQIYPCGLVDDMEVDDWEDNHVSLFQDVFSSFSTGFYVEGWAKLFPNRRDNTHLCMSRKDGARFHSSADFLIFKTEYKIKDRRTKWLQPIPSTISG